MKYLNPAEGRKGFPTFQDPSGMQGIGGEPGPGGGVTLPPLSETGGFGPPSFGITLPPLVQFGPTGGFIPFGPGVPLPPIRVQLPGPRFAPAPPAPIRAQPPAPIHAPVPVMPGPQPTPPPPFTPPGFQPTPPPPFTPPGFQPTPVTPPPPFTPPGTQPTPVTPIGTIPVLPPPTPPQPGNGGHGGTFPIQTTPQPGGFDGRTIQTFDGGRTIQTFGQQTGTFPQQQPVPTGQMLVINADPPAALDPSFASVDPRYQVARMQTHVCPQCGGELDEQTVSLPTDLPVGAVIQDGRIVPPCSSCPG